MSTFESIAAGLAFVGLGIPAWIFALGIFFAAKRPRKDEPGDRYSAYTRDVDRLFDEMDRRPNRAAIMLASLRELRNYPEYRDISVALLGTIDVTGSTHYDQMVINELKLTEDFLLEAGHV